MRPALTLALAAGELLRLEESGAVELACDSGRVWVTEERQSRDTWLDAGQSVRLAGGGLALVEATRPARVRVAQLVAPEKS